MYKCIILLVSVFVSGSLAGVATFIKPCSQTDNECIHKSALIALPHIATGDKDLGLPALDPLVAHNIVVDSGELKLTFTDVIVHGLGQCKINKIERDPTKSTAFFDIECPIKVVGKYVVGGKLLVVDIEGEGPFEIKGDKMRVTATIRLKENTKSGKKHYKISGFDFNYEPLSVFEYKLDNLYGGDRAKAEPVEKILKQSWKELIMDNNIGKPVIKEIIVRVVHVIDKLFQLVPNDELEIV